MKYIEVKINTNRSGIDPILAELLELGIENAMIDDPVELLEMIENPGQTEWLDPKEADRIRNMEPAVTVFFADDEEGNEKAGKIRAAMSNLARKAAIGNYGEDVDFGQLSVTASVEDDILWRDKWKEFFKPTHITERIVTKPTWVDYQENSGEIVVEIDPGMAFGTGTHETTALSIKLLEKYIEDGDKIFDIGCGSGIVSIAAAKLGAGEILAVDIDEEAIKVTKENLELNGVSVAKAQKGDLAEGVDFIADIVVANLITNLVIKLSPSISKNLKAGGIYISSGILIDHYEKVSRAIEDSGFEIIEKLSKGEWCSLVARKPVE